MTILMPANFLTSRFCPLALMRNVQPFQPFSVETTVPSDVTNVTDGNAGIAVLNRATVCHFPSQFCASSFLTLDRGRRLS